MHFHQLIHKYLLEYREKFDSNFNFLVRQNTSVNDKKYPGGKFAHGLVFQGTEDYCFIALVDKSGGANATKSVGIVVKPTKSDSFKAVLEIVFPGVEDQELVSFYKKLASKFDDIKWDKKGTRAYLEIGEFPEDNPAILYNWLDNNFNILRETALKTGIEKLIPDDERFYKLQDKLKQKLVEAEQPKNYWIFQGSPEVYDIINALKAGHLKSWKVAAHKDKINVGDKVIIWQTGKSAGCYALAEVTSEVENLKEEKFETMHYVGKGLYSDDLRVKLKITHYMADDPIYWNDIKDNPVFSNFKAGNQGTNFSATKDQFETLSSFKNLKTHNLKANMQKQSILSFMPLNQILYGPPGTGKTYITKKLAIKLIDGTVPKDNKEVNARYLELLNAGFIDFTTFHQSMTYEDFLEGIKPVLNESEENVLSYEIKDGIFKQICDRSNTNIDVNVFEDFDSSWEKLMELIRNKILKDEKLKIGSWEYGLSSKNSLKYSSLTSPSQYTFTITKQNVYDVYQGKQARPSGAFQKDMLDVVEFMKDHFDLIDFDKNERNSKINKNNYVLIIDEINRGNVASIFGELITLIEKDKRAGAENELSVILPYSKQKFSVPSNLHIIGTMNTADRSIEALDSALRRRFEFIEMLPDYKVIDKVLSNQKFNGHKLSNILKTINERITVLIDRDHQIGHSYFLKLKESTDLEAGLKAVFQNKIIPLLQEYFFNDYVKIAMVIGEGFMDKDRYSKVTFAQNDGDYESDYSDIVKYEIKKEIDLSDAINQLMAKVSE